MSAEGSGNKHGGGAVMVRGRGQTSPPRPPLNPRSTSTSDVGSVQGSDEVLGRLLLDDESGGVVGIEYVISVKGFQPSIPSTPRLHHRNSSLLFLFHKSRSSMHL
jgi:hypothetical protein